MTGVLIRKLLRDIWVPLVIVCLLLAGFQCLWAKISQRISAQLMPLLVGLAVNSGFTAKDVDDTLFGGPGKILKTMMGGERVSLFSLRDMLTIGYVHPTMLIIFGLWGIGRAAGAIAGELDRGTLELLLAQPLARSRLILAHFCIDLVAIPILCLSLWGGTWLGNRLVGLEHDANPADFAPALWNVAALIFAISGYTMLMSAAGRFRMRVLGTAVLITLLQFLANVIGQLLESLAFLRPLTVFYYYQPQQIIRGEGWSVDLHTVWGSGQPFGAVNVLVVLFTVGFAGYALALWTLCRRDLPAPL
jgi:ABC-2 type transport system permease protein